MLFPSLHDSGGWVSLEAMAARRPIVCLDLGGPGLQVTSDVGVKVPALNPRQAIAGLAEALKALAGKPAIRLRLGECARARVEHHFNWDKKGAEFAALYSSVVGAGNGPVPSLSSPATSPTASTVPL
jgi:glycosyltransferase involved in cell wall biosynthesis